MQELSDSRLKLSLLNTQVMQPRNSLSNDFLAKALCYKDKSRIKEVKLEAKSNKQEIKKEEAKAKFKDKERER